MRLLQQGKGLVLQLAALGVLRADIQQTNPGIGNVHELFGIKTAHEGKLQEILRRTLHIRAAVDEHDAVLARREHRGQRGTANPVDPLDGQRRAGEQRAGAAGRDDRVPFAVFQHAQRHRHGRVLFPARRRAGVVLHGDYFARIHNPDCVLFGSVEAGENRFLLSDQRDVETQFAFGAHGALDDFHRGIVAAHRVNEYSQCGKPPFSSVLPEWRENAGRSRHSCFVFPLPGSPGS